MCPIRNQIGKTWSDHIFAMLLRVSSTDGLGANVWPMAKLFLIVQALGHENMPIGPLEFLIQLNREFALE